jgi:hypothetical protein
MTILETILDAYPELTDADFLPNEGKITLQDDGDGVQYIAKWNYSKPIPKGLKLGK